MWRPLLILLVLCVVLELALSDDPLSREERGARKRKGNRGNRGRQRKKNDACKYSNTAEWSECTDGMKVKNSTLLRGPARCEPYDLKEKKCKDKKKKVKKVKAEKCRYEKKGIRWGPCEMNLKTKTLRLKSGGAHCNATKEISKPCKEKKRARQGRDSSTRQRKVKGCKYSPAGKWSDCVDGKKTRTRQLKKGPTSCEQEKVLEKNCSNTKPCKYDISEWSECGLTGERRKTWTLRVGESAEDCEPSKMIRRSCKARECKYKKGTPGECNHETGMLNRTDVLRNARLKGCPTTKLVEVPCDNPNASAKQCKFGPWKPYDACRNGVKNKRRDIVMGQGIIRCEKKAVKIMACEDKET